MSAPCRSVFVLACSLFAGWLATAASAAPLLRSHYELMYGPAGYGDPAHPSVGDVNGDGRNDLVYGALAGGPPLIVVHFGLPGGDLAVLPTTSPAPGDMAAGSTVNLVAIDQDQHLDAVINGQDSVHVLIGLGDGTFRRATTIAGSFHVPGIGDLDGDGLMDLVVCRIATGSVEVFHGDGQGGFVAGSLIPVGIEPHASQVVDADADPWGDILVGTWEQQSVLLRGSAAGSFTSSTIPVPGTRFGVDLNSDGFVDAVGDSLLALGNGDGTFHSPAAHGLWSFWGGALFAADVNGDGHPDLVGQQPTGHQQIRIRLGDGSGGFGAEATYFTTGLCLNLGSGDVDTDGDVDIVGTGGSCIVLASGSDGSPGRPGRTRVVQADPDDVSGPPYVYIHRGTGDGALTQALQFTLPLAPSSVAIGDFDGDQIPDVVAGGNGSIAVALFGKSLSGPAISTYPSTPSVNRIRTSDLNGDSRSDVIALGNHTIEIRLALADGSLDAPFGIPAPGTTDFEVADLDGDGDQDLVLNSDVIYVGHPNGSFGASVTVPVNMVGDIQAVDLNGDGWLDLVSQNSSSDPLVLIAAGPLSYPSGQPYPVDNAPSAALAVARIDGDAIPDILLDGPDFHLFRGLGGGAFAPGEFVDTAPGPANPAWLRVADMDGDGDNDAVKAGVILARSNGDGTFELHRRYSVLAATAIDVADMNGDGRPDVVATGTRTGVGYCAVLLNQGAPAVAVGEPAARVVALAVRPLRNPGRGRAAFVVDVAEAAPFALELLDVAGRRLAHEVREARAPGRHHVTLTPAEGWRAGVYFARVRQGLLTGVARVTLLP